MTRSGTRSERVNPSDPTRRGGAARCEPAVTARPAGSGRTRCRTRKPVSSSAARCPVPRRSPGRRGRRRVERRPVRQHDAVAVLGGQRVRLLVADSPRHGSSGSTSTVRRSSTRARTCADRVRMRSRSSPSQISVCSGTPPLWVERRGGGGAAGRPMGQTILARSGTGSALAPERSGRHRHTIETSPARDVRDEAVAPHEPAHPNGRLIARIAQIEKSRNVTIDVLDAYISALGGQLDVNVLRAGRRTKIVGAPPNAARIPQRFNALNVRNRRAADSAESAEKRPDSTQVSGVKQVRKPRTTAFFAKVRVPVAFPVGCLPIISALSCHFRASH